MNLFKHFIFTRFNYGWLKNTRKDRSGQRVDNLEWLEHRCRIFEKYQTKKQ